MGKALRNRMRQQRFKSGPEEIVLNLLVAHDYVHHRYLDLFKKYRLTTPQYNVLRILRGAGEEGHARCDIAERMVDRSPDVTRILDRLEGAGLVKRCTGDDDRRTSVARITAAGLALLKKMDAPVLALGEEMGTRLTAAERTQLDTLLEKIYGADDEDGQE